MTMRIESTIHYAEVETHPEGIRVTIYRRGGRIDGRQSRANAWKLLHRDVLPVRDVSRAAEGVRELLVQLDAQ